MIIVVEIASRAGTRACKEYDAPSYNAAVEALKRELRTYPAFRVTGIWIKDDQMVQREFSGRVVICHSQNTADLTQWSAFAVDLPVTSASEAETVVRESAYRGNHTVADRQCHQPLRVAALRIPAELPVVQHQIALWQIVHLPSFHTAAIPVDLRVAERDEP